MISHRRFAMVATALVSIAAASFWHGECCAATPLAGTPVAAADVSAEKVAVGPVARIFDDPDGSLTAEALLGAAGTRPSRRGSTMNNFGFIDTPRWFVAPLDNPGRDTVARLLVFDPSWLDDIRVTLVRPDGSAVEQRAGDHYSFENRAIPYRKANFLLSVPPGRSQLLVRVETQGPCLVGMTLWERGAFFRAENDESVYVGAIYGVLGAMLLFNLVLYLSVRERVYAAYVGYLLAFMLAYGAYNGYLYQRVWLQSPLVADWVNSTFIYLYAAAGIYFALQFLELRRSMARFDRFGRVLLAGILATLLVTSLVGGFQWSDGGILWLLACAPYTLLLGAVALARGNRAARYYLPATASGFFGATVTVLTVSGQLTFSFFSWHAVELGMVADAVLLSFALAERLRFAREAAQAARAELLEATRAHARHLAQEVEKRTRELRAAHAAKDRLYSIVAHDLRGPLKSLAVLYREVVRSAQDFNEEILALTRTATTNTGELLEELLIWARSQRGEIDYEPRHLDLAALLGETQKLYQPEAAARGVGLYLELAEPCPVYADAAMVKTILRNLVGNALRFCGAGGRIEATVTPIGDRWAIRIADDGVGMEEKERRALFSFEEGGAPGCVNSGRGLGLILCREFVERHGGGIDVASEPGKGSAFTFTLPRAVQVPEGGRPATLPVE